MEFLFGKKKDHQPKIQDLSSKEQSLVDFNSIYMDFSQPSYDAIWRMVRQFQPEKVCTEKRHPLANIKGGKNCADISHVERLRSIAIEVIKDAGKKILSGDFNLTRISFPIKAMFPITALESSLTTTFLFPLYINRACMEKDPVERFRLTLVAQVAYIYYLNMFLKPLNPIIGQTLEGSYPDGTKMYLQQISHHPPVSYFLVIGPQDSYRFNGYYRFEAHAGWNSMTLQNTGRRELIFANGQRIKSGFVKNTYSGCFYGDLKEQSVGTLKFQDPDNLIECNLTFNSINKKPTDYFSGKITVADQARLNLISTLAASDTLMDNESKLFEFCVNQPIIIESELESDFRHRSDLQYLKAGDLGQAQVQKQRLQIQQRRDAALRKQAKK